MARPRTGPDDTTLRRWSAEGLSLRQMADRHAAEQGEDRRVSTSAIGAQLHRMGLSRTIKRYKKTKPWTVRADHSRTHTSKMLVALEKRANGEKLSDKESKNLDAWLRHRQDNDEVVGYLYNSEDGFLMVERASVPPEFLHPEYPIIIKELGQVRL